MPINLAIKPGAYEERNRIDAENDKRLGPAAIVFDIDQPVTKSQELQRQAAGKKNIRTGPERLVDREKGFQAQPTTRQHIPATNMPATFSYSDLSCTQPLACNTPNKVVAIAGIVLSNPSGS